MAWLDFINVVGLFLVALGGWAVRRRLMAMDGKLDSLKKAHGNEALITRSAVLAVHSELGKQLTEERDVLNAHANYRARRIVNWLQRLDSKITAEALDVIHIGTAAHLKILAEIEATRKEVRELTTLTKANLILIFTKLKELAEADPGDKAEIARLQEELRQFSELQDPEVVDAYNGALASIGAAAPPAATGGGDGVATE